MKQNDDRAFPEITYVRGVSGQLVPVLRDTRLRVQTAVIAAQKWGFSPNQIAAEYDLRIFIMRLTVELLWGMKFGSTIKSLLATPLHTSCKMRLFKRSYSSSSSHILADS